MSHGNERTTKRPLHLPRNSTYLLHYCHHIHFQTMASAEQGILLHHWRKKESLDHPPIKIKRINYCHACTCLSFKTVENNFLRGQEGKVTIQWQKYHTQTVQFQKKNLLRITKLQIISS